MSLVLASGSAARATMLRSAGVEIEVIPSRISESAYKSRYIPGEDLPEQVAQALAEAKAMAVSEIMPGRLILGSDQVLVFEDEILDKPENFSDARRQMRRLRGHEHTLISAAVLVRDGAAIWHGIGSATLYVREYSDAFLDRYLAQEGEAVLSTVGGYRIEAMGAQLFDRIDGDYFSVLGMPLIEVLSALRDEDVVKR